MAINVLDVFGEDKKQPMATLTVAANAGTEVYGFGWTGSAPATTRAENGLGSGTTRTIRLSCERTKTRFSGS